MATNQNTPAQSETRAQPEAPRAALSLDWWSVIVALVLILFIWLGVFQSIPW